MEAKELREHERRGSDVQKSSRLARGDRLT